MTMLRESLETELRATNSPGLMNSDSWMQAEDDEQLKLALTVATAFQAYEDGTLTAKAQLLVERLQERIHETGIEGEVQEEG